MFDIALSGPESLNLERTDVITNAANPGIREMR
jgi:hypothetical protein